MLETEIKKLTAAITKLVELLDGGVTLPEVKQETPALEPKKETPPAPVEVKEESAPKQETPAAPAASMDEVKAVATKLVKEVDNGRQLLGDALKTVGAGKLSEVTEDKLSQFLDLIKGALG